MSVTNCHTSLSCVPAALQVYLEHLILPVNESAGDVTFNVMATGLASFSYEVTVSPVNGMATCKAQHKDVVGDG